MMGRDEKKEEKRGFKKRERDRERERLKVARRRPRMLLLLKRGSQSSWGRSFFLFWCEFCVPE